MDRASYYLTVFFEDPFWVAVFEKIENEQLSVAKVVFGAEPKDYEILEFIKGHYYRLQFSPFVDVELKKTKMNHKRAQKDAKRQTLEKGIGTKSQQALKLQQEQNKIERKIKSRQQKEAEKQRLFELKLHTKKEKHRGH